MKPVVTEGKGGDAFSRYVGRQSPEDILPIDWREEEEGAQSVLMNEATRGPYPEYRALALRHRTPGDTPFRLDDFMG